MKFYREENLPRKLKLGGDYFTLTHKNKPVTDFEASTVLLQLFLWWKDIPITIKINVRKLQKIPHRCETIVMIKESYVLSR